MYAFACLADLLSTSKLSTLHQQLIEIPLIGSEPTDHGLFPL